MAGLPRRQVGRSTAEPTNIRERSSPSLAAEAIAELKGCPLDEVHQATTQNARRLFRLERIE